MHCAVFFFNLSIIGATLPCLSVRQASLLVRILGVSFAASVVGRFSTWLCKSGALFSTAVPCKVAFCPVYVLCFYDAWE